MWLAAGSGYASATSQGPPSEGEAVAAADVGAPPGSRPVAPQLPLAAANVVAAAAAGSVLAEGDAPGKGSLSGRNLNAPVVGMAATPDGRGYWLVGADGGVFTFGDAGFYGSAGSYRLNGPVVGMAATPDGRGYWLVGADGGVFTFGDAGFYGSAGSYRLNGPVVGMAATPDGRGYWLVGADGGVFTFGDAGFYGSAGSYRLNGPVVGMAATPDGRGYWLVGADGGVFTFGDAGFYGSAGSYRLNGPVVGMAATPDGRGYWLVGADGGIFSYGDAVFHGSAAGQTLQQPIVGMASTPDGGGYWLVEGQKPAPPGPAANPFSSGLVGVLDGRAGVISASVLDLTTGEEYQYRPGQLGVTASIVKAEILGTLLSQAQAEGRSLTPTEQSVATSMIEQSDNDSATDLWDEVGGAPAVAAFDRSVGMTSTTPNPAWGLTVTTAGDQITLLQHLVEANPVLDEASRTYELELMENVTPAQAWGVSAGAVPGTTVALKNGWLPIGSGWTINSIGWVSGSGRDYLIAVTTSADPTEGYGIASVSLVAQATWNALGH